MNSSPNSDIDSPVSEIAALREAWIAAVKASDVDRLSAMVTDDVVASMATVGVYVARTTLGWTF